MYDTAIIGAGMSGLAAGIRLAYYDRRVCILERHTTIGGLNSFYRLAGRNYDVGLHAVTNFTPKGTKKGPLARLLRQLRIGWDEFSLTPQVGSRIAFPDATLNFGNGLDLLLAEVDAKFPTERDNFRRMLADIADYDAVQPGMMERSAREFVASHLRDPLLAEMIFCPLMYYGNAREHDMDFGQFCIMFRSIFCEGFARPWAGVRIILKKLVRRFRELGGELRLRAGVQRMDVARDSVTRLVLDDGEEIEAKQVLSSAGWRETMHLCGQTRNSQEAARESGQLSFVECISVLDRQPRELGHDRTIVFFNDSPTFHWRKPESIVDLRSGVICSPNNFQYETPLDEGILRVTNLANYDSWRSLQESEYRLAKLSWYDRVVESAVRFVPDYRSHVVATDMFTPTTVERFTGHENGAVYGAPRKRFDGTTPLKNLFICGTDQGFVGIIGAMVSGITIANQHLLQNH